MLDSRFVIAGTLFNILGSTSYVIATLKGRTRPNRVTWLLWALAPLIAFSAELNQGVGLASLMTFMVGFGPAMILLSSFVNKQSYWQVTRFDLVCGALSVLALVFWALTRTGEVAIIMSILADALAAVPTIVKSYKKPETESPTIFLFGGISAFITLLTIKTWDIGHYAFPLYIFACCLGIFVLIKFPRLRLAA